MVIQHTVTRMGLYAASSDDQLRDEFSELIGEALLFIDQGNLKSLGRDDLILGIDTLRVLIGH